MRLYRSKLDTLMFADELNFCVISSENKKSASFKCSNGLRFIIGQYSNQSKTRIWNNDEFKSYAEEINKHYNNRVALFHESKYHEM